MQRTMIEEDRRGRFCDFAIIFLLVGGHRNDESVHISHRFSPSLRSAILHCGCAPHMARSEEHTSELQSLMRNSYAVFCWKKKTKHTLAPHYHNTQDSSY